MAGRRAMRPPTSTGGAMRPALSFLLAAAAAAALVGGAYFWLVAASFRLPDSRALGCRPDGEGSWAIGVFYGATPFHLRPIELEGKSSANGSAWPVANPVLTCASATDAGYPSNFVADPFLYLQIWVKTPEVLARDRLLGSFSVKPVLKRVKFTLVGLAVSLTLCILLYANTEKPREPLENPAGGRAVPGVYSDAAARSFEPDAFCGEPDLGDQP